MRLFAVKVRIDTEVDMIVAVDSEADAPPVALRYVRKEISSNGIDIVDGAEAVVDHEIRSLEDLPEDFDKDNAMAWSSKGIMQDDINDLLAAIPPEPEGGPRALWYARMRARMEEAKVKYGGQIEAMNERLKADAASAPAAEIDGGSA